ncbi:MAG: histidine kinase [Muribaculaceae bacterium]|nr:histidine kinase [Muribaculaceae bacterium]
MTKRGNINLISIVTHALCWIAIIIIPMVFLAPNDASWTAQHLFNRFMRTLGNPLVYILVFYINYLWLIPRMLYRRKFTAFFSINIAVVVIGLILIIAWWQGVSIHFHDAPRLHHSGPPRWPMYFNTVLILALIVGLSVAIRMAQRWQQLEQARKEAETERARAELSNLRNQLNPHFLLNTLNNIYALTAFDPPKAQIAVGELSKLLRHMLYDNRQNYVPLYKEIAFIKNYIELMKIRLTSNVVLVTDIDVDPDDSTPIAPLIFISIIENAFKHGISQAGEGYIHIAISHSKNKIICATHNSNHPKRSNDKSGSGIGLEQVSRRLELMYPDRYDWKRGVNTEKNEYFSIITLNDNDSQVRDN